jgi:hypothetical protein
MGISLTGRSSAKRKAKQAEAAAKKAAAELKKLQKEIDVEKRTRLERESASRRRRPGGSLLSSARPTPEMGLDDTLGATSRLGGK